MGLLCLFWDYKFEGSILLAFQKSLGELLIQVALKVDDSEPENANVFVGFGDLTGEC